MNRRQPGVPVAVVGHPEVPHRRRVCRVATCRHWARSEGYCWQHRTDVRKLRAIAQLVVGGRTYAEIAEASGIEEYLVAALAVRVRRVLASENGRR